MKIILYHGTNPTNADAIESEGFSGRKGDGNWKDEMKSMEGYVYLTTAYAIFYACNAAGDDGRGTIFKVEVDTDDLCPDEDYLRSAGLLLELTKKKRTLSDYTDHSQASLDFLGSVAIKPESIKILERKDFDTGEMWRYSDPSISVLNYRILGMYYRKLTEVFMAGGDLDAIGSKMNLGSIVRKSS